LIKYFHRLDINQGASWSAPQLPVCWLHAYFEYDSQCLRMKCGGQHLDLTEKRWHFNG